MSKTNGKTANSMLTDDHLDALRFDVMKATAAQVRGMNPIQIIHDEWTYSRNWSTRKRKTRSGVKFILVHRETGHRITSHDYAKALKKMEAFDDSHRRLMYGETKVRPRQPEVGESWWYDTASVAR